VRDGESLDDAMRRHLLTKVGVTRVGHLEQLDSTARADSHPDLWLLDVAHLALIPRGCDVELRPDTEWHPSTTCRSSRSATPTPCSARTSA
jgi:ADP-ribose pyrophosphatase YjhB (NUDIX family)